MIYNKQLYYHRPAQGTVGDCHRTAIACMLDLQPDEVPHFMKDHWEDPVTAHQEFSKFLASRGLAQVNVIYECTLEQLLHSLGTMNPYARYLLGGRSANGTNHTVVARGKQIEWDPSMDDSGIVGPCDDGYFWVTWLIPISMAT